MKAALMVSLWQPCLGSLQLILPPIHWLFKGASTGLCECLAAVQEELDVSGCNRHLQWGFLYIYIFFITKFSYKQTFN